MTDDSLLFTHHQQQQQLHMPLCTSACWECKGSHEWTSVFQHNNSSAHRWFEWVRSRFLQHVASVTRVVKRPRHGHAGVILPSVQCCFCACFSLLIRQVRQDRWDDRPGVTAKYWSSWKALTWRRSRKAGGQTLPVYHICNNREADYLAF